MKDQYTICTLKGRPFNLLNPDPLQIDIHEIAHSLSGSLRWAGQSSRHFTIGQHSIMVYGKVCEKTKDPNIRLAALLHDASEAYTGDISTPLARAIGIEWEFIKLSIEDAVFDAFRLPVELYDDPLIKWADHFLYRWERNSFFPELDWWPKFQDSDLPPYDIPLWGDIYIQQTFLNIFNNLQEQRNVKR